MVALPRRRRRRRLGPAVLLLALVLVAAGATTAVVLSRGSRGHRHAAAPTKGARKPEPRPHSRRHRDRGTPLPGRVRGPHRKPIPILMYHVIGNPPAGAPYPELYVARHDLLRQVGWLALHHWHAITLQQAYDYWRLGYGLPPHPVVLTFDDGYRGDYTAAMPILARYHWRGVLNLAVHNEDGALRVWQIRRLVVHGWEVDAHTINHVDLTKLDAHDLRHEVLGSRQVIRRQFHVPVLFFCYPSGRFDAQVIAAVRAAGFLGATTVNYGAASPSNGWYTLDRVRINRSDGLSGFVSKLLSSTG